MKTFSDNRQKMGDMILLAAAAAVLGAFLIARTTVISEDGVVYIERARQLPDNYQNVASRHEPIGLPVLIFLCHGFFLQLTGGDSPALWCLAGQVCVLGCRILTIAVLYLWASRLFGRQHAVQAMLALIVLPYPAQAGADVLREWPFLLFLSIDLLLFCQGSQTLNGVLLGVSGLSCGLGTLIRPECAQVLLYGLFFFAYKTLRGVMEKKPLQQNGCYIWLAAGFLMVFLPYALLTKQVVPHKLNQLLKSPSAAFGESILLTESASNAVETAGFNPADLSKGLAEAVNKIIINFLYYFAVPAGIGFYLFYKSPHKTDAHWLWALLIGFYLTVLCVLYMRWGYISRRHLLPATALLSLHIPAGLNWIACRLVNGGQDQNHRQTWLRILLAAGILICIPKLLKPLGHDKKAYLAAARWLAENTTPASRIYTFDRRIPFYADRPYRLYRNSARFRADRKAEYLIVPSGVPAELEDIILLEKTFSVSGSSQPVVILKRRR
ncbi:MAG TPA: glycosyltransferase family 39 protein [Anaerohalosphaeraceae bacterium]|nr:glycosyltransferase family 39 protein [Anaerohalosphaeraceae bacterium]